MSLRPYQQEAHDAVISAIKYTTLPICFEAATGAGKSHLIASLAETIHRMSKGKHILCLAPSAELVEQNSQKYKQAGFRASIYSASAGEKSLRHPVVFGTPMTVANSIDRFDSKFAAIILDECHTAMTPTVQGIIASMSAANKNLRVIGMTATPYRMGTGYIFANWADGSPVTETKDPYFASCVHRILARPLIDQGYLTNPIIGEIGSAHYDTLGMRLNQMGRFDQSDIDRAYQGQGRKTAAVIADVIRQSHDRKGVIIFAATVQHAKECMSSLPPELSALVTGETPAAIRRDVLKRFKAQKLKYIVNVSVLTTGFDAPHVDVIALLRATESVGLLQQICGRGLRISDGKQDCLLLDYAENIERHCPDGDIFDPDIKVNKDKSDKELHCICPLCKVENVFTPRLNKDRYDIDVNGYFTDLDGNQIQTEWGAMPAHFGRRCQASHLGAYELERCTYRWTFKECPHCMEQNDIAARYCIKCKGEIVDPNEKLMIEFKAKKKDPTKVQTDKVIDWTALDTISSTGKPMTKIDVVTSYRRFTVYVMKQNKHPDGIKSRRMLDSLQGRKPGTVTYQKDQNTMFYRIIAYDWPVDEPPKGTSPDLRGHEVSRSMPNRDTGAGDFFQPFET